MKSYLIELILRLGDLFLKTSFVSKLRFWRKTVSLKKEELRAIQKKKLLALLAFASQNSPYYHNQNVPPKEDAFEWLQSFPVIKKSTIR